ncbi:TIGR03808 family TAT-translocated repetitive protein [Pelagibacterium luteolum]|uniref:Twin-arg-translocated uncharacterized repeat-containing protein n=1 Tax=Pelagibacterium luteolum TaxID=440168 RepID=A0A1G7TV96_9HYPH|nr:TIGR03808 family TAT-translocated repetitive protein [Pelagibacterium luteolum]SDG38420.1 twin-arg-translocated uncharacterized repeat-containing protein [Pelagibacterium luteolum]
MPITRRQFVSSAAALGMSGALPISSAIGQSTPLGLVPDGDFDQTATLQLAIEQAATEGHLFLPAGRYMATNLRLPSGFMFSGVPGATIIVNTSSEPLLLVEGQQDVTLYGLVFDGNGLNGEIWNGGLVHIANCARITVRDCRMSNTALNGLSLLSSSGTIENCSASDSDYTGIFVLNADGVRITGNRVFDCRNGGIRVWRSEPGADGTLVVGNTISGIDWADGGNGQNGNGINVFQADNVTIADNMIADCTFSAIRLNATNNTQITGNTCLNSGEVAVYSEFSFTGSVISNNIIDGAAAGISITNFNEGGRLATCTSNIVRNLLTGSTTNPDLETPYGIAAEADAIISGNVIENVAGSGIQAGWGPYLRDVTINDNLIRDVDIGVSVSVAPEAGAAIVAGNMISGARRHTIVGAQWSDIVAQDLAATSEYPQVTVRDNVVL